MTNDNLNRRSVIAAAMAASLLVLALGLIHRTLAARLLTPLSKTPIDSTALDGFPLQIHDWTGQDVPMDEAEIILNQINAEASINRRYLSDNGMGYVSLFIAATGTTLDLVGHPPEICNVVSGYSLIDQRFVELPIGDGTKLACRIVQFSRDAQLDCDQLDCEKKAVLYYYVADGQFYGDRSQLRSRVRRGPNMVNCIAQVQITASSKKTLDADSMVRIVSDFAVDSGLSIADLFEHIQKGQNVDSPRALKEGGSR